MFRFLFFAGILICQDARSGNFQLHLEKDAGRISFIDPRRFYGFYASVGFFNGEDAIVFADADGIEGTPEKGWSLWFKLPSSIPPQVDSLVLNVSPQIGEDSVLRVKFDLCEERLRAPEG